MTPLVLLADLQARGVVVEAHGDRLRIAPADRLTPAEPSLRRASGAAGRPPYCG